MSHIQLGISSPKKTLTSNGISQYQYWINYMTLYGSNPPAYKQNNQKNYQEALEREEKQAESGGDLQGSN